MQERDNARPDAAEIAVWIVSALLLGPMILVAAIPLLFVVGSLWFVLILPVIAAGKVRDMQGDSEQFELETDDDFGDVEPAHAR